MKIPQPFIPVRVETNDLSHTVHVIGRDYTFGPDGLLSSIVADGKELLAAPMRIVSIEDGEPSNWDMDYPNNESESFIQHRNDQEAVICGAMQSDRFIIDTCNTVDYDGNIDIDFKLMTRGKTVAQVFGIAEAKPTLFKLDQLWLEVPLKAETATHYNIYPNSVIKLADGTELPSGQTTSSGRLPEQTAYLPFKSLLWLGDANRGLGWFAESFRNWQPISEDRMIEVQPDGDTVILRIRLLDSHPEQWNKDPKDGAYGYTPINFHFGFHATPVKPFPKQPYIHNAFHVDCGIKIEGNYIDYFNEDNRFDLLVERGVTTLILHEKWNKSQNWFELSEFTAHQLQYIVDECHKRGIKVLPYFGYEISTMAPVWNELSDEVTVDNWEGKDTGAWWRLPFQRDYIVCYNSGYQDLFINGIEKLMDTHHIDGVYLDGTSCPRYCHNLEHGCGWYDSTGKLRGTYPIRAIRKHFKRLYDVVASRGGQINVHSFGFMNFTALPYIHQSWLGENLQFVLMKGNTEDVNLDYFRTEYIGRNMGVPVEFIAYANPPHWTFENAVSMSILHGILPRPNHIDHPLELMSGIWKIFDSFPIEQSDWVPYWKSDASTDHEKVKVSYYRYTDLSGSVQLLAFVSNISAEPIEKVTVNFAGEPVAKATDMTTKQEVGFTFDLDKYGYRILFVK